MDIHCRHCGEPWDTDELHQEADNRGAPKYENLTPEQRSNEQSEAYKRYRRDYDKVYKEVSADFRKRGCPALGGKCSDTKAHPGIGVLTDLLGDDTDGLASMTEDLMLTDPAPAGWDEVD